MNKEFKKKSGGVNFARARFKQMLGVSSKKGKYHQIQAEEKSKLIAFAELKIGLDFPELCNSVDYLSKNIPSDKQQLLWGNPLPNSYSQLGKLDAYPYIGDDVNDELNFCLVAVRKYKHEINLFLKYKDSFEASLLIGNYLDAEKYISKIENEICYSLWTLESRFVLKEISGKASESKELLSHFNQLNSTNIWTKSLAHHLSLRAEHSLSVKKYLSDLETSLSSLKNSDTKEAFKNYYRFKLTFLNHIDFNNYGEIISLEFPHSIIDRYLNLTRVLTNLLAVSSYLSEEKGRMNVLKTYLHNRVNYLLRKIEDPILYKLKLLSGEALFPAFDTNESEIQIKIIDNYTIGLYDIAEKDLCDVLLIKPTQFDLYVLYVKSLIYQRKPFVPVGAVGSLQNQILSDIYKIISVEVDPGQAGLNLLRIANNITSFSLSYGITDFVFFQTKGKQERMLLSRISYSAANPIIYEVFTTDEDKLRFLDLLSTKFPDSITIEFFKEKLKGIEYLSKFEKKIPTGKYKLELARTLQENRDFLGAVEEWEYIVNMYKDTAPIFETAIINLFKCYLELELLNNCINLYVDSFFFNNHIVDKIETKHLIVKISSNKFRNVEKTINLPIFYTIVDADIVETHITFEQFNEAQGIEKPSELLSIIKRYPTEKIMYFLEFVCSPKVLMHSTYINNSKERLEERLSIINFIRAKYPTNKNILAEIKSIQNILVIQQGLIDLDESKIYVNEQGIIEKELQEYRAVYNRFAVISQITDKTKLLIIKDGNLTTYSSKENTTTEKVEYSTNPVFDIYLELFNAVKDKFLNSQFGIVAYLSTRIRHGVLVGELRPIFETHNLITLKEGQSLRYRRNLFWDLTYSNHSNTQREQIQITLSDFSSKIDGLIFDLIKKHLQVYKEDVNEGGWFNYEFDDSKLWYPSVASIFTTDFESFVHGIFSVLWKRTDENLELIRTKIQTDILNQFNNYFDELERDIVKQLGENSSLPIIKAIKNCSTEIQTVIQKISRWFKRSEIKASDFTLSELIDIIIEYTNKSSWQKSLLVEKEINFDCKLKGEYKTHFADLIRIFLENIIKHSDDSTHQINCTIITELAKPEILEITIKNEVTDENSIDSLKTIWKNKTPDTSKLLDEGKSGYHKAIKILTSDLRCSTNGSLDTKISDDNKEYSVSLFINIQDLKA